MNTRTAVFEREEPIGTNWTSLGSWPEVEDDHPDTAVATIDPREVVTMVVSKPTWTRHYLIVAGHHPTLASTVPHESPWSSQADSFNLLDYIAHAVDITNKDAVFRRITNLIRAYRSESDSGDFPSLLSIKDFYHFMQSTDLEIRTPSLTISAAGLLRAQWTQGRERVIVQFRGDEDVDYVVVVHHPRHWGRFERKSGRCLQTNLLDNLSDAQKGLLTQE